MKRIGIIGAGAWGTALALVARRAGLDVVIQAREANVVDAINETQDNKIFLPGVALDKGIRATASIADAIEGDEGAADALLLTVPAQFLRAAMGELADSIKPGIPIVICAKGIEQDTGALMSEIAAEVLTDTPVLVLSGPTFAAEVAAGLPAAVTLACQDDDLAVKVSDALAGPMFRIYRSDDLIGAQIGGALKNVMAIAAGIAIGRGLGENARAAIMTRGFAEMVRLALAKGARLETLAGLSGLGDLLLTCSSAQSRNFSLGKELGEGEPLQTILSAHDSVAEGVTSAPAVVALGDKLAVDLPIAGAVDAVLHRDADIDETIAALLARPLRPEY